MLETVARRSGVGRYRGAMTTLVISGEIVIDPDDFDAALAIVEPLVAATQHEAGCLAYDFWVDPRNRGRFRVFEEWESAEANAAHSESAHLAAFYTAITAIQVHSAELSRFVISSKSPL